MIGADDLRARLDALRGIGYDAARGTTRLAWTEEDAAAGEWFAAQAAAGGLEVGRDAAGNRWATPPGDGPWWAVGSHTDSVRDGGMYDGALGVAAAFAIAAAATVPLAVISFADEEGARFNTPTFGSRALTGVLDVEDVLARRDDDGVSLAEAMRGAGVDPDGLSCAPRALERLRGFVELHIDQSLDVVGAGAPAGIVTGLASRLRARVTLTGISDHAGTTPPDQRRDALLAAARLIVAAEDLRAASPAPLRCTAGRILVTPNALTSIASEVTLWLDARAADPEALGWWLANVEARAGELAAATGVEITVAVESRGAGVTFDAELRAALRRAAEAPLAAAEASPAGAPPAAERSPAAGASPAGASPAAAERSPAAASPAADAPPVTEAPPAVPDVLCWAGHDAGVLAARVPAAMVLVRNATGVSHSAAEHVELEDAAAGATLILRALEGLA